MEGISKSKPRTSGELNLEQALRNVAKNIGASEQDVSRASVLLRQNVAQILEIDEGEEEKRYWGACALMAASCRTTPLPVAPLLTAIGGQMKVTDFFERTKATLRGGKAGAEEAPTGEALVRRLEQAFMVTADVFRKFRPLFKQFFKGVEETESTSAPLDEKRKTLYRCVWLFYITSKARIFHSGNERSPLLDHVSAYHFLVACMIFMTEDVRNAGLRDDDGPPRRRQRVVSYNIHQKIDDICNLMDVIRTDVSNYLGSIMDSWGSELEKFFPLGSETARTGLHSLMHTLTAHYEAFLKRPSREGTVDERKFTDAPETLGIDDTSLKNESPVRSRPPGMYNTDFTGITNSGGDALDALAAVAFASPRSPCDPKPQKTLMSAPQTPVSVGVVAVSWLQNVCKSRPETPQDEKLRATFSQALQRLASKEQLDLIYKRASKLLTLSMAKIYDAYTAKLRKREALALYFASLEGILVSEEKRLRHSNFNGLLDNDVFHRAMLACAAESASVAYGRREFSPFPEVLKDFDLETFDMTKVIESFLRHTPGMPRTIGRHLARCEERILESLAWQKNSCLVRTLQMRENRFPDCESQSAGQNAENEANSLSQGSQDFMCASQLSEHSDTARQRCTDGSQDLDDNLLMHHVPDAVLEIFFRKLLYVASVRVQELSSRAGLNDSQTELVWKATKTIISDKWRLLVDRHLDQMIMCCVYGVAKVISNGPAARFSDITYWYKTLPHTREPSFQPLVHEIIREVSLSSNGEKSRGDIIGFYNKVFVHQMKSFLLQNGTSEKKSASEGKVQNNHVDNVDPLKVQIVSSPLKRRVREASSRVVGKVTVTTMSPHGRKQLSRPGTPLGTMSPATKTLYAFGESPIHGLYNLNRSLDQGRHLRLGSQRVAGGEGAAVSAIRRKYADVFAVEPSGSVKGGSADFAAMLKLSSSRRKPPLPPQAALSEK
mmetsp:Transcript_157/g.480  ORF Transcript_157/g.480 Transcript_157/m.480 type:complete len:950 (+) Transcript_157:389-3238(+)|eukprot:CAMPEP_0198722810 /NCGR_PEP_ID=MMETSP1475-20131203/431_1 /TAXON_ID= ORGANISM="Unidentified sp., Strain CCMP1999" /NCGR_SAMPLE_ID=MMETSP1475 /ASSEMBLY_ACC=CAM_ASM_001111 /LENGTH=949 /DNA_ID=CAMNT_0044483733 /DNA_START=361 /DNA_END=3210 /DNA_ORIENTATION=-